MHKDKEFKFTDENFNFIKDLVFEISCISLNDSKKNMMYSRLARVIRKHNLSDFDEYCELLAKKQQDMLQELLNAITTNVTNFFREQHHFDFLTKTALPEIYSTGADKIRIWSAGCSTGPEPYSIAITIKENLPSKKCDLKILATDLSLDALDYAKSAIYNSEELVDVPDSIKSKYFSKQNDNFLIKSSLKELITFNQLNLFDEWPMKGSFQVIFCRNVIIYFDKDRQQLLFDKFYNALDDNGYLLLGHSEHIPAHIKNFEPVGRTIYRKVNI